LRITHFFACLLLVLGCLVSVAEAQTLRTVAFSGDAAPGMGVGVNFGSVNNFGVPVLNDAGQTAFVGFLTGTGVSTDNRSAIWSEGGGNGLALVARAGSVAPGTGDSENFFNFSNPVLNDSGQLAFAGYLDDSVVDDANQDGIWIEEGGSEPRLVARVGGAAPGTDSTFELLSEPSLSSNGSVGFAGILVGATPIGGSIWSEGDGSELALVALKGNQAPGTESGVTFNIIFAPPVRLNGSGQTAFSAFLRTNDFGVWSEGVGSGLALVVRRGSPIPGDESGAIMSFPGVATLNDSGQLAFASSFIDPNNPGSNSGIWKGSSNGLALVAREGNPAPGTESGVDFARFPDSFIPFEKTVVLNGNGQTAFMAPTTGPGTFDRGSGIWSEGNGNGLALVARQGSAAPGTESGLTFGSFGDDDFVLNKLGQTAFRSQLNGTVQSGIWAQDLSGNLRLIALTGDLLDVDDGSGTDFREISGLDFARGTGNEDGLPSGFNDLGQLAFLAHFTDGTSGVFVSSLVAIPEPSTLLLGAISALGMLMYKRR